MRSWKFCLHPDRIHASRDHALYAAQEEAGMVHEGGGPRRLPHFRGIGGGVFRRESDQYYLPLVLCLLHVHSRKVVISATIQQSLPKCMEGSTSTLETLRSKRGRRRLTSSKGEFSSSRTSDVMNNSNCFETIVATNEAGEFASLFNASRF